MFRKFLIFCVILALAGCSGQNSKKSGTDLLIDGYALDGKVISIDNSLFSVPSPHQIAKILAEENISYDNQILNPAGNIRNYTNSFKKALNLGVYGADLGYINQYGNTQDAITYFSIIKGLSQQLDLINAIKKETFNRIEKNIYDQDSLITLLSNSFQEIDLFLKSNSQEHIGVLILTGGWVESMYILSKFAMRYKNNQELTMRLCENKKALSNLIKIISHFAEKNKIYETLIELLIELENTFDYIEIKYIYEYTETLNEEKITKVYTKTKIEASDEVILRISEIIEKIRNFVIL